MSHAHGVRGGERFYIYAARKWAGVNGHDVPNALTPALSRGEREKPLPTGVIVGTAVISHVSIGTPAGRPCHQWHLTDVQGIKHPRKPRGRPQPVWFRPF